MNSRLEEFTERENILQDTQNGFRKMRCTIDNIYILNHCVNKSISKGQKLYAFFVDFRAAFDSIDRPLLFEFLNRVKAPQYLISAITDIYRCTPFKIEENTFYTEKGLKQGCPLSPLLFAIFLSDLEKTLKNFQSGGVVIGREKIFSLAYADDLVLLSEREDDMREMIGAFYRYTVKKKLTVNTSKSKMMVFSRGGRMSKNKWCFGGSLVEEVKYFKYLGFNFQSSGKYNKHMEAMNIIGKRRVAEVWSLGERKFKDNFGIRMQLFNSLIVPSITYGAEITGWTEFDCLELTQRRYLRWTLGLDRGTKKAILMEETKAIPLYIDTGTKAMKYEERSRNSPCMVLRECLREIYSSKLQTPSIQSRKQYLNRNGWSDVEINSMCERGESVWGILRGTDIDCFRQLQFNKISSSRYSSLQTDRVPWYLQRGRSIKLIARFRCGNEERGDASWRSDGSCRVCGVDRETVEHMRASCCLDERPRELLLNERGQGESWMKEVIKKRKALTS